MADLVVQDFDEEVKREMKVRAAQLDITLKDALTRACQEWVKKK